VLALVVASPPPSHWSTEADTMVKYTQKWNLYVGHVQNCTGLPTRHHQYPGRRRIILLLPVIIRRHTSYIAFRYIPPRGNKIFSAVIGASAAKLCLKQYTSFLRRRAKNRICSTNSARARPIGRIRRCDRHRIAPIVVIVDGRQSGERRVHYYGRKASTTSGRVRDRGVLMVVR
jgi:hypothetical protein